MDGSAYIRAGVPMKRNASPLRLCKNAGSAERLSDWAESHRSRRSFHYQERTRICDRHENFARKRKIGT